MKRLEQMSVEEKIGQMLLFGWPATEAEGPSPRDAYPGAYKQVPATSVTDHLRRMLTEWKIGAVILMGRNVESPEQVAGLANEIQDMAEIPLFVSIDQEGGHVCRVRKPFTMMPGNMPLGATRDEGLAYAAAEAMGEELSAIGVNLNFAPSADVNNNPDNPIIGVRSFGADPELVSRMVVAQVRGYQSAGMISCAKHFPGHGDTSVDSHLGLARLTHSMERLERVELAPFRAAIAAGVPFVMTTHIIFEALDPDRPATLSPNILNGLLRRDMGFDGVVVTDSMEMLGIINHYGIGEAAVMAIEAGVDLLAVCHTPAHQSEVRDGLLEAAASGRLSEDRINESVRRILACKEQFGLNERRQVDQAAVMSIVGAPDHLAVEQEVARKSITVVKDEAGRIPLPAGKIVVVGPEDAARAVAGEISSAMAETNAERRADVTHTGVGPEFSEDQQTAAWKAVEGADAVVFLTRHKEPWTTVPQDEAAQADLVKGMVARGLPVTVVALRNPYDLRRFPDVPTYLCTYGYTSASLAALAEVLVGAIPAQGRLPVEIPTDDASASPSRPQDHGEDKPDRGSAK